MSRPTWVAVAFAAVAVGTLGHCLGFPISEHYSEMLDTRERSGKARVDVTLEAKKLFDGMNRREAAAFLIEEDFCFSPAKLATLPVGEKVIFEKQLDSHGIGPFIFASLRLKITFECVSPTEFQVTDAYLYQLMP